MAEKADNALAITPHHSTRACQLRGEKRQSERNGGQRAGATSEECFSVKVMERWNRELPEANEIVHKASVYFVQAELNGRFKP